MGKLTISKLADKVMPYYFKLAWLNLQRNARRSLLSVMIIAITVFAMTAAGGFGLYTYQSLQESTARDVGHITLSVPGYFEKDEEMPLSNGLNHSQILIRALLKHDTVRAVQPRIYFTGLVSNGSKSAIFTGTGVNDREFSLKGPFLTMREGKTLSDVTSSRYDPAEPEVMLGADLANNMNVGVGDWITLLATTSEGALNAYDFKVRGLYSTGVPELDKRQLYIHIQSAQELLLSDKVSTLSVFLNDTAQTDAMMPLIDSQLNLMVEGQGIELTPWQDRAFFYNNVKNLYDLIFGMMGLVMGLVVFVSLFNTMTMSVTERTREIGTLSALGSFRGEIIRGFLRESGLLAVIGAGTGALMSAALSLFLMLVEVNMPPPPGYSEGYPLQVNFSLELVLYATSGVLVICLVAAFFSARKGVNKPITEALSYV
ncbi:ABC transporter permease [Photobacterium alginatilyticum]|uniref:ABC transporter permease n=1 Tax=Photobacterium alginatilyticum TaxID=1775171 RepID=A0ABW9YQZ2_9GAMM|nr:ABC transporter permease [Photobacterium alginatilyticum]NBI55901.1 ABC transporter permease [Photobacterium alginatilyticum]